MVHPHAQGTPKPILDKLEVAGLKIVKDADTREFLGKTGSDPFPGDAALARKLLEVGVKIWGDWVKLAKVEQMADASSTLTDIKGGSTSRPYLLSTSEEPRNIMDNRNTPHELDEMFPQAKAAIHDLKTKNAHFANWRMNIITINRAIHRMETNVEPTSDEVMERTQKAPAPARRNLVHAQRTQVIARYNRKGLQRLLRAFMFKIPRRSSAR